MFNNLPVETGPAKMVTLIIGNLAHMYVRKILQNTVSSENIKQNTPSIF